ncbi:protein FAM135A-like isoform X2 [Ornithodoros turicata]|uniref:protein FAM135A-like isoform X2 n=1 Tax=Ornithodoros turicata TaxID=34597 RepID=UPI0031393022
MPEFEAVVEFVLEISNLTFVAKQCNGHYNIHVTPGLVGPISEKSSYFDAALIKSDKICDCEFPAGLYKGTGITKTRFSPCNSTKVTFGDVFLFKLHVSEDVQKMRKRLAKFYASFVVELYSSSEVCQGNCIDNFNLVSRRTMQCTFNPNRGLFHHIPLLLSSAPLAVLNITIFSLLTCVCLPSPRLASHLLGSASTPRRLESTLFDHNIPKKDGFCAARNIHRELCYILLTSYNSIQHQALSSYRILFPLRSTVQEKVDCNKLMKQLLNKAEMLSTEEEVIEFSRSSIVQLCCYVISVWDAFIKISVRRPRIRQHLCMRRLKQTISRYQETHFVRQMNRCDVILPEKTCDLYSRIVAVIRRMDYSSVLPPLEVICVEMDLWQYFQPEVIFEENFCRFSDDCRICGHTVNEAEDKRHQSNAGEDADMRTLDILCRGHLKHDCRENQELKELRTPMLFASKAAVEIGTKAPARNEPSKNNKKAFHGPDPDFLQRARKCFLMRQIRKKRDLRKGVEPLHFVIFVHGLGGSRNDFHSIYRWMRLFITTPTHLLICSKVNEKEKSFDTLSVCGSRLAKEVDEYLNDIGDNYKLSFVAFSMGCLLVRVALTCPEMQRHRTRLHTFLSLNGPHLGVSYANSSLVKCGISLLSAVNWKTCMKEMTLKDSADVRSTYIYMLSLVPGLEYFKNVILMGSSRDKLVPIYSSNIQHCNESLADKTVTGKAIDEMILNLLGPLLKRDDITLTRYNVFMDFGILGFLNVFPSVSHVWPLACGNLFERLMLLTGAEYFN